MMPPCTALKPKPVPSAANETKFTVPGTPAELLQNSATNINLQSAQTAKQAAN